MRAKSAAYADDSSPENTPCPPEVHFPPTPGVEHLVGIFFGAGQITQTAQGIVPLTWCEIKAFLELNEVDLCTWEIKLLKRMSEAYCVEYSRGSDPDRKAPYSPSVKLEQEVDQVAKAINIMKGLSAFKKAKG